MTLEGELTSAQGDVAVYETIWLWAAPPPCRGKVSTLGTARLAAAPWAGRGCSVLHLAGEGKTNPEITCDIWKSSTLWFIGGFHSMQLVYLGRGFLFLKQIIVFSKAGTKEWLQESISLLVRRHCTRMIRFYLMGCWNSVMPAPHVILVPNDCTIQRAGRRSTWLS